jgi:hypothetical protein
MTDNLPEEINAEEQNADELENELLDAMRDLGSKNRKIEEYLDSLARTSEKPPEKPGPPAA